MSRAPERLFPVFFGCGLVATTAQTLLLRELVVDVAGDESAIGTGLAAWLSGIAAGAVSLRRLRPESRPGATAVVLALLAGSPALAIAAGRLVRLAASPPAGELPGLGVTALLALVTLAPAGALVGAAFTLLAGLAATRRVEAALALSRLYAVEALGSVAGGVLVTLVLAPHLSPLRGAFASGLLTLLAAMPAARAGTIPGERGLALAAGLLGTGLLAAGPLDAVTERARFAGTAPGVPLRAFADTPYQHLAIGGDEVRNLWASGQYVGSFPDPYGHESLAHLAACLAAGPRRVLSLGGVELGALRFLLRHPVETFTLVSPDQHALAFLESQLPEEDAAALHDPRVRVVPDDPRRFLAHGTEPFDLILLLGPDPVTLLSARTLSLEFFRDCAARLSPRGVLVVSLRTAPAVLTGETAALAGSVYGALRGAFPLVRATPGPDGLLLAGRSRNDVTLDPALLAERWRERRIPSSVFVGELFAVLLPEDRVAATEAALAAAARLVPPSRDDRPVSFLHALARRQRETASRAGRFLAGLSGLPPPALAALALLPSLAGLARAAAGRSGPASAAQHAIAAAGAAAMGFSLLLFFSYQTHDGALYGRLGLLTALFMAGLSAGATAAAALRTPLSAAMGIALSYSLLLAALAPRAERLSVLGSGPTLAVHGSLLALAGAVTGAVFPAASLALVAAGFPAGDTAARLEAADHLGAALAALLGSVVFVPALGLAGTAWLLFALLAVAFVRVAARGVPSA